MPAVSVVIPTFNRCCWTVSAVASVLAQTFIDLEVIVVDDGSSDGTSEVLGDTYGGRIRVTTLPENVGRSAARNIGWKQADSELIAFLDSDDAWLPGKLAAQVPQFDDPAVVLSHTWVGKIDVDGQPLVDETDALKRGFAAALERGYDYNGITRTWCMLYTSAVVMRRTVLEATGGFDPALSVFEDWDLFWQAARVGHVATVPLQLTMHRAHDGNISPDWRECAMPWLTVNDRHLRNLGRSNDRVAQGARANLLTNMALGEYWHRNYPASGRWMRQAVAADPRILLRPGHYVWNAPLMHAMLPHRIAEWVISRVGPDRYLPPAPNAA